MAEDQSPIDEDKMLSEIALFMSEKGISVECGACGQDDKGWVIYRTRPNTPSIPTGKNGDFLIGGGAIEALGMHCKHCGYLRLFEMGIFNEWKQKNASE